MPRSPIPLPCARTNAAMPLCRHLGYYLQKYTATYRGFDKWLGYYNAAMGDYWYHGKEAANCLDGWSTDLSNNTGPTIAGAVGVRC